MEDTDSNKNRDGLPGSDVSIARDDNGYVLTHSDETDGIAQSSGTLSNEALAILKYSEPKSVGSRVRKRIQAQRKSFGSYYEHFSSEES